MTVKQLVRANVVELESGITKRKFSGDPQTAVAHLGEVILFLQYTLARFHVGFRRTKRVMEVDVGHLSSLQSYFGSKIGNCGQTSS